MLNYTSLFSDLEGLFENAGRSPGSFRRFSREVDRVGDLVDEYCNEVASDYVIRLEQRLTQPDARLTEEEVSLLRAYLGLAPPDSERDQRLVEDLAHLEGSLNKLLELKDRPLSLKNLDGLRTLLARMKAVLPRIIAALEERERLRRFEQAVGALEDDTNREWLLRRINRALEAGTAVASSEETIAPFGQPLDSSG